jgi:hypothetical protein
MKKPIFFITLLLLTYFLIELFSFLGLVLLKKLRGVEYNPISTASISTKYYQNVLQDLLDEKTTYLYHSSVLGWTIKPNGFWLDLYRANSKGIRGDKEYQTYPEKNIIRISTFGDSFTHCDGVKNEHTWQEQMNNDNPKLEVLNFGAGGYGFDQAFLRYKQEGILYNSHIIFIGFMEENIKRLVNVFRPFYLPGIPLTKPRFFIRENELVLLNNPLAELNDCKVLLDNPKSLLSKLGENDYYYKVLLKESVLDFSPFVRLVKLIYHMIFKRYLEYFDKSIYKNGYYNKKSEAFKICTKLFDEFYYLAQKNKSLPVIILLPNRFDIKRYREDKSKIYSPLIQHFDSKGYQYIDLINAFERYGKPFSLDDLFSKHHYSPLANSMVAKFILDYLNENNFMDLNVIENYINDKHSWVISDKGAAISKLPPAEQVALCNPDG